MQLYNPSKSNKEIQEDRMTGLSHEYPISPWQQFILDNYSKYLSAPILDVGTRNGLFLDVLKEKGFDAEGLELTDIADYAISLGRPVTKGDIQERTKWSDKHFNTIIATHVIEHCFKPHEALEEMKRLLSDTGYIIFAYPIAPGEQNTLEGWGHYIGFESNDDAVKLFESHGFKMVEHYNDGPWNQVLVLNL